MGVIIDTPFRKADLAKESQRFLKMAWKMEAGVYVYNRDLRADILATAQVYATLTMSAPYEIQEAPY